MAINASSLEIPTPISMWQLPRRFDAVTWFVRLQRQDPNFLNDIRVFIPQTGPSLLQVKKSTNVVHAQLGATGETSLGSGVYPWHGHDAYLENLGSWTERHVPDWPATVSITWILCLHREAWLAVAGTWLPKEETSWLVKSAWLTLAFGSADLDLLSLIPDHAYDSVHVQVYAYEADRALRWLEISHPNDLRRWLAALSKRSFFKTIWSRLPLDRRLRLEQQFSDILLT